MAENKNEDLHMAQLFIESAVNEGNTHKLLGMIAGSLVRIARSQEEMVELAHQDIEAEIEAQIQGRAEQMANEIDQDKSKRSFIGKR